LDPDEVTLPDPCERQYGSGEGHDASDQQDAVQPVGEPGA